MGSRVKQATVLTVVAATFASAMYGIALAHTPHVPQVSVTWDAWHLTGTVAAVSHSAETYSSYSRASWSHTHTFFAKIEWLDDHGLFWDTHGEDGYQHGYVRQDRHALLHRDEMSSIQVHRRLQER